MIPIKFNFDEGSYNLIKELELQGDYNSMGEVITHALKLFNFVKQGEKDGFTRVSIINEKANLERTLK